MKKTAITIMIAASLMLPNMATAICPASSSTNVGEQQVQIKIDKKLFAFLLFNSKLSGKLAEVMNISSFHLLQSKSKTLFKDRFIGFTLENMKKQGNNMRADFGYELGIDEVPFIKIAGEGKLAISSIRQEKEYMIAQTSINICAGSGQLDALATQIPQLTRAFFAAQSERVFRNIEELASYFTNDPAAILEAVKLHEDFFNLQEVKKLKRQLSR